MGSATHVTRIATVCYPSQAYKWVQIIYGELRTTRRIAKMVGTLERFRQNTKDKQLYWHYTHLALFVLVAAQGGEYYADLYHSGLSFALRTWHLRQARAFIAGRESVYERISRMSV